MSTPILFFTNLPDIGYVQIGAIETIEPTPTVPGISYQHFQGGCRIGFISGRRVYTSASVEDVLRYIDATARGIDLMERETP